MVAITVNAARPLLTKHFFNSVGRQPGVEFNHWLGPPAHLRITNPQLATLCQEGIGWEPTVRTMRRFQLVHQLRRGTVCCQEHGTSPCCFLALPNRDHARLCNRG